MDEHRDTRKARFDDIFGALGGSHVEGKRHLVVRCAFLNEFVRHEKVARLFAALGDRTQLQSAAERVAVARDKLAKALGLKRRSDLRLMASSRRFAKALGGLKIAGDVLYVSNTEAGIAAEQSVRRIKALIDEEEAARADLERGMRELAPEVATKASSLVKELLRPGWPWVATELLLLFFLEIANRVDGVDRGCRRKLVSVDELAPDFELHVTRLDGERKREAAVRVGRAALETIRAILGPTIDRHHRIERFPKKKLGRLEDYARWFFRNRILGESINRVAKEYCKVEHKGLTFAAKHSTHDDRAEIRRGIAQAEIALGVPVFKWKLPREIKSAP